MKTHDNRSDFIAHQSQADRAEDQRAMREFFATPAGRDLTRRVTAATWTPSPPDAYPSCLSDTEAGNPIPPSDSRTFRPVYARQARRVSWWPLIIATAVATVACAVLIGWFVAKALGQA